jgi:hypothetical protein
LAVNAAQSRILRLLLESTNLSPMFLDLSRGCLIRSY